MKEESVGEGGKGRFRHTSIHASLWGEKSKRPKRPKNVGSFGEENTFIGRKEVTGIEVILLLGQKTKKRENKKDESADFFPGRWT